MACRTIAARTLGKHSARRKRVQSKLAHVARIGRSIKALLKYLVSLPLSFSIAMAPSKTRSPPTPEPGQAPRSAAAARRSAAAANPIAATSAAAADAATGPAAAATAAAAAAAPPGLAEAAAEKTSAFPLELEFGIRRPVSNLAFRSDRYHQRSFEISPILGLSAMASPVSVLSADDLKEWHMAMFGREIGEMPRSVRCELCNWILDMCKRYGEDGMGDKPAEVSTTLYWLQHLGEGGPNPHLWRRLRDAAEHVAPKPKKARLTAKAKSAPTAKAEPKTDKVSSSSSGAR